MLNYLSVENLYKRYGTRVLFSGLSFGVSQGDKIALVGRNGCGKSSLLRAISGQEPADSGTVAFRKGIRVDWLEQEPQFEEGHTVRQAALSGDHPALLAFRDYEILEQQAEADPKQMQAALDRMDNLKAWDCESRSRDILGKLGLYRMDQPVAELSGGQRKRLALARCLVNDPDFLILDEPTNHLDIGTIEWLESWLSASTVTLMLVTHDRWFLDRVCNQVMELDQGELYRYEGDYEDFLTQKADREAAAMSESDKARNLLRKELEWLRRQPKARTTKSKARIDAAEVLKEKALAPQQEGSISIGFGAQRLGSKILEITDLNKAYGDLVLLKDFTYVFRRGERIGLAGPNGIGKTTFLNLITGREPADSGKIDVGETIRYGYYSQSGLSFKEDQRVIEVIRDAADYVTLANGDQLSAGQALTLFGFPPAQQYNQVSSLSGGERRRLYLLRVLMEMPNFLILDEPTNDLDLITLNTLEDFLLGFPGCLMVVSHDRYFLDKLTDHLFVFEGEGVVKPFVGNFREYREKKAAQAAAQPATPVKKAEAAAAPVAKAKEGTRRKLSYKEQKEYETLGPEIEALEKRRAELLELMNSGSGDHTQLAAWAAESERITDAIAEKEMRWLELDEIAAG